MTFMTDNKAATIRPLLEAFFEEVLPDDEPICVSDEATILDVASGPVEEVMQRCSRYYRSAITKDDLRQPLWLVLPRLEKSRRAT